MGRRPNQVVNSFFERGRKIADSSNRYEHTCKRCGELYPKGRVNVLLNHILRQCKHASARDREVVDHYLRHPEEHALVQAYGPAVEDPPNSRTVNVTSNTATAPRPRQASESALYTLAEASGHHHIEIDAVQNAPIEHGRDQSLMAQLRQAADFREDAEHESRSVHAAHGVQTNAQWTQAPTQNYEDSYVPAPQPGFHEVPNVAASHLEESGSEDVVAEQISTPSPNEELTFEQSDQPENGYPSIHRQAQSVLDTFVHAASPASWGDVEDDTPQLPVVQPSGPTASRQPAPSMQTTIGTKGRNKFTDERRQEVLDTRRRGACLRCRMLKKTCSDGDPCLACSQVESARLWQGTCVRARLAEVFTLWSAPLFHSLARIQVPAAVQGFSQLRIPGRMEARFFAFTDNCLSFTCKQYHESPSVQNQQQLSMEGDTGLKCVWLLDDSADMGERVQLYARAISDACIEHEALPFVKATLRRAKDLAPAEEAAPGPSTNSTRSGYKLSTQLLQDVVELWVLTQILAHTACGGLELQYSSTRAPRQQSESVPWVRNQPGNLAQEVARSSHAHGLVKKQLLAIIEGRASILSKAILNEMEKRLLQRRQMSRFDTFISAVVLLSCVERMTGIYRAHDGGPTNAGGRPTGWPLHELPSHLWAQGDQFANLLTLLLRLRGLPPRIIIFSSGLLGVVPDTKRQKNQTEQEQLADLTAASSWLDPLRLHASDLSFKLNDSEPGPDKGTRAWDMRYISRILLP